ncbi:MAG: amidohydrolase [Glaciihabitans sp.]|nr:amidohydrolase [Glaciihabitans sp.]
MLLRNARLGSRVVDVRVGRGVIIDIAEAGQDASQDDDDSIDLAGRWLGPGLWDNHVHFSQWALQASRLDVADAPSAAETARRIAAAMRPGAANPFVAVGFRDALWPDAPNLADLDAASPSPIVVVSGDLHSVWLNSAALEQFGHRGHPTGLLREEEAFRVTGLIDTVANDLLDGWADAAARAAATRGVVGIVDYEMGWNLDTWTRRQAAGTVSLRVEFGVYPEHLDRAISLGLRSGDRVSELLTMGNLKILIDGSLNTRTAYCYDEFPGTEGTQGSRGLLTVAPDHLVALLRIAAAAGIESSVHAIGDHANTVALDAFAEAGIGGRIEHAQLVSDSDLPRFGQLGVVASVQPDHAVDDRDVADRYWAGRTGRAFPLQSLLAAGATLLFGSDAPVSRLDPWVTIAAAVMRTRGGRAPWHPEQAVDVAHAIAASSRTTVSVGQPADLVITDIDPLTATPTELRLMPVAATLLAGQITHTSL